MSEHLHPLDLGIIMVCKWIVSQNLLEIKNRKKIVRPHELTYTLPNTKSWKIHWGALHWKVLGKATAIKTNIPTCERATRVKATVAMQTYCEHGRRSCVHRSFHPHPPQLGTYTHRCPPSWCSWSAVRFACRTGIGRQLQRLYHTQLDNYIQRPYHRHQANATLTFLLQNLSLQSFLIYRLPNTRNFYINSSRESSSSSSSSSS